MATRKLKVFRTAIGFHDAYVAAPSRKAALAAWGASADLFARGVAEEVDDPELTAEPLARPGEVVKRSRGTAAEQIAALPPEPPRKAVSPAKPQAQAKAKAVPKPSRAALDAAERALAEAQARHHDALAALAEREARLARERRELERQGAAELRRVERARDEARAAYEALLRG